MYRKIDDFLGDWSYESDSTIKILKAIPQESINQRVTPNGRSLGFIAWHLTLSIAEMLNRTGLSIEGPPETAPMPESIDDIISAYEKSAQSVIHQIMSQWSDGSLTQEVDMYGERWSKGKVLSSLITHQTHHRGQMTVLMRQAGLPVPGVYGPSLEEWAKYGMPPME